MTILTVVLLVVGTQLTLIVSKDIPPQCQVESVINSSNCQVNSGHSINFHVNYEPSQVDLDTSPRDVSCPDGYTIMEGGSNNHCFKLLLNSRKNWEQADGECKSEGDDTRLATLDDAGINPAALRKFIVRTYGDHMIWLGAKGTGVVFDWKNSNKADVHLQATNANWYTGQPGCRVTTEYCLLFLAYQKFIDTTPNKPYYSFKCDCQAYPLCERPPVQKQTPTTPTLSVSPVHAVGKPIIIGSPISEPGYTHYSGYGSHPALTINRRLAN